METDQILVRFHIQHALISALPGIAVTTNKVTAALAGLILLCSSSPISAAEPLEQQGKISDSNIFAQVNGKDLSKDMYIFLLQAREKEGNDESELQDADPGHLSSVQSKTAKDLIMTTLLAQQATALDMHNAARYELELELFKQTLLAQLFVQHIMDNIQIEEALIRERYEQQPVQTLYRFMIWETPDAELAIAALKALTTAGLSRAQISQLNEVETPWLPGNDIDPQVQPQVLNLNMNEFAASPIYQDGVWKIVQLIDRKAFAKQSYELERDIIRSEMVSEQLQQTLDTLLAQATIRINEAYSAGSIFR